MHIENENTDPRKEDKQFANKNHQKDSITGKKRGRTNSQKERTKSIQTFQNSPNKPPKTTGKARESQQREKRKEGKKPPEEDPSGKQNERDDFILNN